MLVQLTIRISQLISNNDIFARLGGDEFVLVITNVKDLQSVIQFVDKLNNTISLPIEIYEHSVNITCSIGICLYPKDGNTPEELLHNADLAMYIAKHEGKNKYQFYEDKLNEQNRVRFELESDLHDAILNSEFVLYYQPQIDIAKNKIIGVEALIRWQHPQIGMVPPIDFIDTAEEAGLMPQIGEWVLRTACRQNKEWQDLNLPVMQMSVNVSKNQLDSNFINIVKSALLESGLEAKYLLVELTKNIVINNQNIVEILNELRSLGVKISFDDFGTGSSSLDNLRKVPVHQLKIDRTFVANINSNTNDNAIILAILTMAADLGLEVIAEGVETTEQLYFLNSHDCNLIQGYLFSKPLTTKQLEDFISKF